MGYVNDPNGPPLRLETTRGLDATVRFPKLAGLPAALAPHVAVVDGELVAFDGRGRPSFGRIQDRIHVSDARAAARRAADKPVTYLVFDLHGHQATMPSFGATCETTSMTARRDRSLHATTASMSCMSSSPGHM